MGYSSLVKKQVKQAFRQVKDLAVDVVFSQVVAQSYDFKNHSTKLDKPVTVTIKGIPMNEQAKEPSKNTLTKTLMFNSEDISLTDTYDTAIIDGVKWKPVRPFINDGYTTMVSFAREV
jgi:hypothetical protein